MKNTRKKYFTFDAALSEAVRDFAKEMGSPPAVKNETGVSGKSILPAIRTFKISKEPKVIG